MHAFAECLDHARNLVAGHERIRDAGIAPLLGQHIAVADAACVYAYERLTKTGPGNLALDQLELTAGLAHLHCSHPRQRCSISRLRSQGMLPVPEELSRRGSS